MSEQHESGLEEHLFSVYVPTNHVYIGDVFLVNPKEIIRPQLTVREGSSTPLPSPMRSGPRSMPVHQSWSSLVRPRCCSVCWWLPCMFLAKVPLSLPSLCLAAEIVVSGGMSMPSVPTAL